MLRRLSRSYVLFVSLGLVILTGCGAGLSTNNIVDPVHVTIGALPSTLVAGGTLQLTATVTGSSSQAVIWDVNGLLNGNSTFGTISATGLYTAPNTVPANPVITLRAMSAVDNTQFAIANITITPPIVTSVAVICTPASILTNATATCSAIAQGIGSVPQAVSWTATNGSITSGGSFTPSSAGTAIITATSLFDPTKSGSTSVTVTVPITITSVSVNCTPGSILNTQMAQCTSTVQGTGSFNSGVSWYVNGIAGGNSTFGTISAQGLYQAPDPIASASITISAISQQDPTKQGSANLSVSYPQPTVSGVTPANALWMGPAVSVQVSGSNFSQASTVSIAGSPVTTTYVSSSQLTATVPVTALQSLGSVPVTVSTSGPGGGTSAGTLSVVGGTINVTISSLPSSATASIQITGPQSFNQTVSASSAVSGMAAGVYTISAGNGSTTDSTFLPDQAVQSATVASLSPVAVSVNYGTGVLKGIKVLDTNGMNSLVFIAGQQTLMVNQSSVVGMNLQAGDTLDIPDCTAAPGGAIVKVTSAGLSFDQVVVNFTPGTISDVFSQMNIQVSNDLTADALPYVIKSAPGVRIRKASKIRPGFSPVLGDGGIHPETPLVDPCQDNWMTVELDGEVDLSSSASGEYASGQMDATASGTLQICPSIILTVHKIWGLAPDGMSAEVKFSEYGHLAISDEAAVSLGAEKQLFEIKGVPIPIGPPGTPLYLQPVVTAKLGATGNVSGRFSAGGEQTVTGGFGVSYANGNWSPFVDPLQTADGLDDTELAANASTNVYIKANIALNFNAGLDDISLATVGVYVEPQIYVEGDVDTTANPWWTISDGMNSGVGVTASIFGFSKDYPGPVTQLWPPHIIATAGGPFLPANPTLSAINPSSPTAQATAQTLGLSGTAFVSGMTLKSCLSTACTTANVSTNGSSSATASVLLNHPGSWTFQLQGPGNLASSILRTTVLPPAISPTLTSVSGVSSAALQSHSTTQTLVLTGTAFESGLQVHLCASACYPALSGTQIGSVTQNQATVYATLGQPGAWTAQVLNPDGGESGLFSFTVQPAFGATVSPGSGTVGTTQFTITGVGASANGAITRIATLPDGSTQTSSITANGNGGFSIVTTASIAGPYVETYTDAKTGAKTAPLSYSAVAAQAVGPTAHFTMTGQSQTASDGGTLTLSVATGGSASVSFTSTSNAGSSAISTYAWTSNGVSICGNSSTCSNNFSSASSVVVLTVTDANGKTSTAQGTVVVTTQQTNGPAAHFTMTGQNQTVNDGGTLNLSGAATVSFVSTSTTGSSAISTYAWTSNGASMCGNSSTCSGSFSNATNSVTLTVTDGNGKMSTAQATITVTTAGSLSITAFSTTPSSPVAGQVFTLNVSGSNFNSSTAQFVFTGPGCAPCVVPNSVMTTKNASLLIGPATLNTAGSYTVAVQNGSGGSISNTLNLTIGGTTPTLTTMSTNPTTPVVGQQFTLTLNGSNFNTSSVQMLFTGTACTPCTVPNNVLTTKTTTQIVGPVTLNNAGSFNITVQNGTGGGTSNALTLTIGTAPPMITLFSTSPSSPTAGQLFTLNVSGSNFNSATAQFVFTGPGCSPCTVPNSVMTTKNASLLIGPVTLNTAGSYSVAVQNGSGGATSNTQALTVALAVPTVSSINPNSFTLNQGGGVVGATITGTGFTSQSWVQYSVSGGALWADATVSPTLNSSTSLTIDVNTGTAETQDWRVCEAKGTGTGSNNTECSGTLVVTVK